jgi:hypothetical protein
VKTENRSLLKGLNFPLAYFEVNDEINDPDIILNIGKFTPSNNNCYLVDHKYHIKENYFYCKDSNGKARWEVEIDGFEHSPTVINFNGKMQRRYRILAPDILPQDSILLPIIELLLGEKGFLLTHSGGIVEEGKAIILLGRSGNLKTTIIMDAVKHNHKILGDERLILHASDSSKAYVFPIFSQILDYTLENFNDEYMSIIKKLLLFKNLRRERSPNSHVWQREPVNIKTIYLLKRKSTGNNNIGIHSIAKDRAIQKIIANNKAEIYGSSIPSIVAKRNFMAYMTAYSFVFPDSQIAKYWENIKKGLEEMLNNIPIYEIESPQEYSFNGYQSFQQLVKEIE